MSKDVLSTLVTLLTEKVGQERFDLWFRDRAQFSLNGKNLVVETPNRFTQDWLRQHYRGALEAACREAINGQAKGDESVAIEFRVNESMSSSQGTSPQRKAGGQAASPELIQRQIPALNHIAGRTVGPVASCTPQPAHDQDRKSSNPPVIGSGSREEKRDSRAARTMGQCGAAAATTPVRRFATLGAFVVGAGNRLAHTSAQMAAERPGSMTPLLVYGTHGTGKTHLLEGIWSAARMQNPSLNGVYLSAEQFTTFFVGAARGGGMPSFRRKYRAIDLLLIDDLQFLVGKKGTLVELLHTMDTALRDGRQLVFAADRPPAELSGLGTELSTRLAGGMVCSLEPPDQPTRFGLVQQFGRRLGIELSDEVAEFVAAEVTGGAREICGAVKRLYAASRMLQCSIDRAFAQEHLSDLVRHAGRPVRLADIERAVCQVFQLSTESLQSQRRAKHVSTPRTLAMWLARKYTRAGLAEIGEYFGRRSHSTVISAQKRVSQWIEGQSEIELTDSRCKVDEALRRVEAQIRTA